MNRPILLVSICAAMVGISYGMHSPVVPVFAKDQLGADYSTIGLIGMMNYLPYVFAPFFIGMLLDRFNKSYLLASGVAINVFSIFMLSTVQSIPEIMIFRTLAGVAHAFFWPSSETLIATNSTQSTRVKGIATFTAAWVGGFMIGPLIGKVLLDLYDYRILFVFAAVAMSAALVPSLLSRKFGRPVVAIPLEKKEIRFDNDLEKKSTISVVGVFREIKRHPVVSGVLLYYAVTFGVVLAVYPAYMRAASMTTQEIEILFFIFGVARFGSLFFVHRLASPEKVRAAQVDSYSHTTMRHGTTILALAVSLAAVGMLISFLYTTMISFGIALVLVGIATSIFYPMTLNIVTSEVPAEKMGATLGRYEAIFGAGWTVGPIAVGLSSDAFGASSPYLGFFVIGAALSTFMIAVRKK